jgi:hypothetical protein
MEIGLAVGDVFEGGFLTRLAIDLTCVFVLVRVIYYRTYRRADLFLTFFSFNLVIFLIAFVLNSVEMTLGAAFGLFAVFSMLRYRTEGISTVDMTYLFLGIAMGLMMAISSAGPLGLLAIGAILLTVTQILEGGWLTRREFRQEVLYDRIDLVNANARAAMIQDLRQRTGLDITRVSVEEIDLLKDAARVSVYHSGAAAPAPLAQAGAGPVGVRAAASAGVLLS